ncbi:hypothetical protein [Streptomyces sp. NPDC005077]|uniref:hypothetical protein n=1 Tax=Streptomyces sp. NPDC005077 TaxID=3154292 RepID=UPI00339DB631
MLPRERSSTKPTKGPRLIEEIVYPQTFKGFKAKVTLYADRVEIKRALSARISGPKDAVVLLVDLVRPLSKPATPWINGYVYLATNSDLAHLSYWEDPPKMKIGGNPHVILFTWFQRTAQADFLSVLNEAWHAGNSNK